MHMHGLVFNDQTIPRSSAGRYHLVETWGYPHSPENYHLGKADVNLDIILSQTFGTLSG